MDMRFIINCADYITDWKKRRKKYYDKSREMGQKTETIKEKIY